MNDNKVQFNIQRVYLKDLSFESPMTPDVFTNLSSSPKVGFNFESNINKLADDPELHVINQAATVDYNNCDALPPSTITINDNDVLADGVGQNAVDYTYQWFKAGTTPGDVIAGQTGAVIDLSALATADPSFIIADRYYVIATNSYHQLLIATSSH